MAPLWIQEYLCVNFEMAKAGERGLEVNLQNHSDLKAEF